MKAKLFRNKISVRLSKIHNYGVFADKNIRKGEVLEECYIVSDKAYQNVLGNHAFEVGGIRVFPTGYGMIFNHSSQPSAVFNYNEENKTIVYKAKRFIRKGEEILIDYGSDWFSNQGLVPTEIPVRIGLVNAVTVSMARMALVSGIVYGGIALFVHYYQPLLEFVMMTFKV